MYLISFTLIVVGCISSAVSQNGVEKAELNFEALALGHTGLLVSWDAKKEPKPSDVKYNFYYRQFLENTTLGPRKDTGTSSAVEDGQVKISDLEENAKYQIIIERKILIEGRFQREGNTEVVIEAKTGSKSNAAPAKPDFKYSIDLDTRYDFTMTATIIWLPCGMEHQCKGGNAGTHFGVKYKLKNSQQLIKVTHTQSDRFRIRDLFPDKLYEVVVFSVNGDLETESDSQEFIVPSTSGPVQEVKTLPLGDSGFLLTWKPPHDFKSPIIKYNIKYGKSTNSPLHENYYYRQKYADIDDEEIRAKLDWLSPSANYTIFILPVTVSGLGTEFKIDVTTQKRSSLPLAKPEFTYSIEQKPNSLSQIKIRWYPCGKLQVCENTRPGTAFYMKFKTIDEPVYSFFDENHEDNYIFRKATPDQNYEFIIGSMDGSDKAESEKQNIYIPKSNFPVTIVEALESGNVTLTCKAPRSPQPDIQWFWGEKPVKYSKNVIKLDSGDLKIRSISVDHMFMYTCLDQNLKNHTNASTYLRVFVPTRIRNRNDFGERSVSLGEKVELVCQVSKSSFFPVEISWLKDGKDQGGKLEELTRGIQIDKVLSFSVDSEAQFGRYTCLAKSRLDEIEATVTLVKTK